MAVCWVVIERVLKYPTAFNACLSSLQISRGFLFFFWFSRFEKGVAFLFCGSGGWEIYNLHTWPNECAIRTDSQTGEGILPRGMRENKKWQVVSKDREVMAIWFEWLTIPHGINKTNWFGLPYKFIKFFMAQIKLTNSMAYKEIWLYGGTLLITELNCSLSSWSYYKIFCEITSYFKWFWNFFYRFILHSYSKRKFYIPTFWHFHYYLKNCVAYKMVSEIVSKLFFIARAWHSFISPVFFFNFIDILAEL